MGLIGLFTCNQPKPPPMTASVTVDCLGEKFQCKILATKPQESKDPDEQEVAQTDTTTDAVDEDDDGLLKTVGELRHQIAERFEIDPVQMKIIHRGKLIGTNMDECLYNLRFKDKDVIKVMGRPPKADPGFSSLRAFERSFLVKLNKSFEQNGTDLDLLEKNFLDGKEREEMISRTEKTLRQFNETAEKHLEAIDALEIYAAGISEDQKTRNREKRKEMVNGILQLLNLNDKYLHRLDDYRFRVEHPDEGR